MLLCSTEMQIKSLFLRAFAEHILRAVYKKKADAIANAQALPSLKVDALCFSFSSGNEMIFVLVRLFLKSINLLIHSAATW